MTFKKAFAFIKAVLKFFKFSNNLTEWITILLKDFIVKVVQAGNISKKINIERGCRQGDPITSLLFILCIEILLISIRTSETVKPFMITYQLNPVRMARINKYMEDFADDITLRIENTVESLTGVTNVIENFGKLSGLRMNKDKTQAMLFGLNSENAIPTVETMGFEWVQEIEILGVTITCNLKNMELHNFETKYEAIEKMLKHWSYRTLNLEGRITITKFLALPKLTHLATVLPELDNQKAKKVEDLTTRFIWKTLEDQRNKKKLESKQPKGQTEARQRRHGNNGHNTLLDGSKNRLAKKILQKDYLEEKKTNNIHHQPIEHDTNKDTETEDWLKLLINKPLKISGDLSLTTLYTSESIWPPPFSTGVYRNEEPSPECQRDKEIPLS